MYNLFVQVFLARNRQKIKGIKKYRKEKGNMKKEEVEKYENLKLKHIQVTIFI